MALLTLTSTPSCLKIAICTLSQYTTLDIQQL